MSILYKDEQIVIADTHIQIKKYFFPLCTSKTILYSQLSTIAIVPAENVNHLWGTCGKYIHNWFNCDSNRSKKSKFIEFNMIGQTIRPSVTPDHPQQAFEILFQKINSKDIAKLQQQQQNEMWRPRSKTSRTDPTLVTQVDLQNISPTTDQ